MLWFTVPAKTYCRGDSTTRIPYGGGKRCVVLLVNAFIRATSALLRLSSSDNSMIQTPRVCICRVFAPEIRQFIGEVLTGEPAQRPRFADALRPFEDQVAISFRAWLEDPGDCGNQPTRYDSSSIVELAWALILATARNLMIETPSVRSGGWHRTVGDGIRGKVLGTLGLGNIGSEVAHIARAFGMDVQPFAG